MNRFFELILEFCKKLGNIAKCIQDSIEERKVYKDGDSDFLVS